MEVWLVVCLLLLGVAVGFAAGLLGIGGDMLLVPFLTILFAQQGMPADLVVQAAMANRHGVSAWHSTWQLIIWRRGFRRLEYRLVIFGVCAVRRVFRLEYAAQQKTQA